MKIAKCKSQISDTVPSCRGLSSFKITLHFSICTLHFALSLSLSTYRYLYVSHECEIVPGPASSSTPLPGQRSGVSLRCSRGPGSGCSFPRVRIGEERTLAENRADPKRRGLPPVSGQTL